MSCRRRRFSAEFKGEAARRASVSVRSITEVAAELALDENALGAWVRAERARLEAAKETDLEPLTTTERAELFRLPKRDIEQDREPIFLGKVSAYFAGNPSKRNRSP